MIGLAFDKFYIEKKNLLVNFYKFQISQILIRIIRIILHLPVRSLYLRVVTLLFQLDY